MESIDEKLDRRIALLLERTAGIATAELEAMPSAALAHIWRDHMRLADQVDLWRNALEALDWQAIARDALSRGNTALCDAILSHARHVEELEEVARAAERVYADASIDGAWTDLFEALSGASRLPGDSAEVKS